jgi:hypothetical protein
MIEKVCKEEIPKLIRRLIECGRLGSTDSKRADTVAELFSKKEELNKIEVIKSLFPDKEVIKVQNSFKKFVSDFNRAAKAASLSPYFFYLEEVLWGTPSFKILKVAVKHMTLQSIIREVSF